MKLPFLALTALVVTSSAFAGASAPSGKAVKQIQPPAINLFDQARRPITNPTLFDLPLARTQIHPIFVYHKLPDSISTILGELPVGGDVQYYALQIEIALSERWSINAVKDGYFVLNPDSTLSEDEGWANIGAGLKYVWLYRPEEGLAADVQVLFEAPLGNESVFQGEGDGVFIPTVGVMKIWDRLQVVDQLGLKLPIDRDAESTSFYNSLHVSYAVTDWLFPTAELNWFAVLDSGDGGSRFGSQVGGLVPAVVQFEGSDVFNFGAANAEDNAHLVTAGLGFRVRPPQLDRLDVGFAWEFPLTGKSDGIFENRFTVDLVWRF